MIGPHDIAGFRARLASSPAGAVTMTGELLQAIRSTNEDWHIFISLNESGALRAASEADLRRASGQSLGPIDGIPVAIKDNIGVAGLATTDGTRHFRGQLASEDSAIVAKLRAAGAIILGKLNMHECALGATTDNPFWGRCENPTVPGHTPGGSSGGSAAAIAAGFAPLTIGTDTMGSVRIPAAYCGTWGFKPTAGLVSRRGLSMLSWTLDTIGLLARSPEDLATGLSIIAGFDPGDPWSEGGSGGTWTQGAPIILGVPEELSKVELADDVARAFRQTVATLQSHGVVIRRVSVRGWDPGKARRAGLLVSEAEVAGRLGGVLDADPDGFSDDFRALVNYGRRVPGERLALAYRELALVRHGAARGLAGVDALLMPTAPQSAFPHGAPVPANQADMTALANIAGLPAVALPLPVSPGDKPQSCQLVGQRFEDATLITLAGSIADLLERGSGQAKDHQQ